MHIGVPCKALVEKGALVKKGTVIAAPDGLGAVIHAPVDGKVISVGPDMVVINNLALKLPREAGSWVLNPSHTIKAE
jgi:Na+-translocating ferredoxin:NAD+ oxidoreductase RnfC subunit